jgi:formate--tetrahydrofolate ligase
MTEGRPIDDVARTLGLHSDDVVPVGRGAAKVSLAALTRSRSGAGRVVLVSALTPARAGEGKTTVSVALAMGLSQLGRRAVASLRQPSLGPVFGLKGGGTGGGRAQVEPADRINLHFTGDIHAVASAHNLLAALVDNELHFNGRPDPRRVTWPRVVDMNDRALRHVVVGLGGPSHGVARESRFEITAASEVMAILCLASSREDLRARLSRIVVGRTAADEPVTAGDLGAVGAMDALLGAAIEPNLVQTSEGTPALVHGGPFANIAHGCSSVLSTRLAAHYADDVITEAGFGFELGGEKFLHLKCPVAGVWPRCVVLVATLRGLARHGGAVADDLDLDAILGGFPHLDRQIENIRTFGLAPVVGVNVHAGDPEAGLVAVERHCAARGVRAARVTSYSDGGAGALELAARVGELIDGTDAAPPVPRALYAAGDSFLDKLRKVARPLYGARDVLLTPAAARDLGRYERWGHGGLPPCIAKTPLSLSDDPARAGVPGSFDITVTGVRLSAGAGFLVALCGDVETMPGLPREPAARRMHTGADGRVVGLMRGE